MSATLALPFVRHETGSFAVHVEAWHRALARLRTGRLLANEDGARTDEAAEMRAIAAGDPAAYGRLVDREAPRLLRFARGLLGNAAESEDVVQDTLIRLWTNAASWTPDARVGTWLHRVCYNAAIDRIRRRRAFVDESVLDAMVDPAIGAEAGIVRSETIRSVQAAIALLPERYRTAILLFHFQDMSQRDAASVMGISEDALESLLARARRRLRELLHGERQEADTGS